MNTNADLNPQDETSIFARMTTEELAEYDRHLDTVVGIGDDMSEYDGEPDAQDEPSDVSDAQADSEWLASAGMGMDEDYAPDAHLDAAYEERTELDFMGD